MEYYPSISFGWFHCFCTLYYISFFACFIGYIVIFMLSDVFVKLLFGSCHILMTRWTICGDDDYFFVSIFFLIFVLDAIRWPQTWSLRPLASFLLQPSMFCISSLYSPIYLSFLYFFCISLLHFTVALLFSLSFFFFVRYFFTFFCIYIYIYFFSLIFLLFLFILLYLFFFFSKPILLLISIRSS